MTTLDNFLKDAYFPKPLKEEPLTMTDCYCGTRVAEYFMERLFKLYEVQI